VILETAMKKKRRPVPSPPPCPYFAFPFRLITVYCSDVAYSKEM